MNRLLTDSQGRPLFLDLACPLGSGKEGDVLAVPGRPEIVAKIFKREEPPQGVGRQAWEAGQKAKVDKVRAMVAGCPGTALQAQDGHVHIAWPTGLVLERGRVAGFLMPQIPESPGIIRACSPKFRRITFPTFTWSSLHHVAMNLARAFTAIHDLGFVMGDVNDKNILINAQGKVTLIDTDSFQVTGPDGTVYPCTPVGFPEFTPPELVRLGFTGQERTQLHDRFGLGTLIFKLLMEGCCPFDAKVGPGSPLGGIPDGDVRAHCQELGLFPHSGRLEGLTPPPNAPDFAWLHPAVQTLFLRCFHAGYESPDQRPSAWEWDELLQRVKQDLVRCDQGHDFFPGRKGCPWCGREARRAEARRIKTYRPPAQEPLPARQPPPAPRSARKGRPSKPLLWTAGIAGGLTLAGMILAIQGRVQPAPAVAIAPTLRHESRPAEQDDAERLFQAAKATAEDRKKSLALLRRAAALGHPCAKAILVRWNRLDAVHGSPRPRTGSPAGPEQASTAAASAP